MTVSSRLTRALAAVVLGAALLAPVAPALPASATPAAPHGTVAAKDSRTTRLALAAYGDADGSGAVHLSGSLRWAGGKSLGRRERVELWSGTGAHRTLVRTALTDRHGDVELRVRPTAHTTYQLRFAGSRSRALPTPAAPSRSRSLRVRAVSLVSLTAPRTADRGERFVVTGTVVPAGARRVVTLTGDGRTFATLTTRADGTFSGHVRLQRTTTLRVVAASTKDLDGASSARRVVRVG